MDFVWTVVDKILTEVSEALVGENVQVEPGWPGDLLRDECIWVDEVGSGMDGQVSIPALTGVGEPEEIQDVFTIPIEVRVANAADLSTTMRRLLELVRVVRDVVKNDATLDYLEDLDWAEVQSWQTTCAHPKSGVVGFGEVVIRVQSTVI